TTATAPAATAGTAAPESCATRASLRVLVFNQEGRPVAFDSWHDDLQLYLLSNSKDNVSLFDHVSGAAAAPPATADGLTNSQWLSRDAIARLAIRNHLPVTERAHFGEHKTAQALYDAFIARYSSPATAALGRLLLPYLFPELSAFATVADLVTHLRSSDARYCAALLAEFLAGNPPLIAVAVGAARGTLRSPFFEGCSPFPLSPSFTSAAAANVSVTEDIGAASTSAKRRNNKGKGGRGGGGGSGGGGGGSGSGGGGIGRGGGGSGGGGGGGTGGGSGGGSGGGGGGSGGSGGSGGGGTGGGRSGPRRGGPGGGRGQQQQHQSETQSAQQLLRAGQTCGRLHIEHRCFTRLDDARRAEFGDDVERPHRAELLRSGVAIFDLDYDAIISTMYALSFSAEGDCYRCVPPDPGIVAAALGASASGTPPGTAPAEALHTFTLDSGASRCFFRDSTTLTPLPAPVPVRLADPSGAPVVARSSTVLLCPAVPSGSLSGLPLPSFSTNLVSTAALQDAIVTTTTPGGSSLYTLATEPPQTLLWHHRLGHPSLPRLRGMHSRLLLFGLSKSLPPLPPSPAPPCLPCVEGRQRAAPHSSSFPPTTAPLQTLHMDVWGPARVSGQGRKRYFLLVVDDYTRYTIVFPLRSNGEISDVLIPWIRRVRLQLPKRLGQDLPVLRLHSDRGGKFSSDLLRDFCRGEGILQLFTLSDSPRQNGIAERPIGLVMEFARTSMIHAAAPHFLWSFAVGYAAHQLNLWPRVSFPETSPTLRWRGKVGDASVFGSGVLFYHPTSRRVLPSQDVTFDESVPFYCLFPYRSAPPPPSPLFLAPSPPPVDPLQPQCPAPSSVSQVDPLPSIPPVQVAVGSSAAPGAASGGAASGGAEPGDARSEGAWSGGAEPEGIEPGGAESKGAESGGAEPRGAALSGGPKGASPRLSSQHLREWLVRRAHRRSGAPRAGGAGDTGAGLAAVTTGAGGTGRTAATGPGGARTSGAGTAGTRGVGCAGAGVAGVGGPGRGGARAVGAGGGGTGAGGTGAARAGAVDPGAGGALTTWFHWDVSCTYSMELLPASLRYPPGASRVARHTEDYTCGSWVCSFYSKLVVVSTHRHVVAAVLRSRSELQKRHTCTDLGELRSYLGLQITRDRAWRTITLTQSHMVHQVLQLLGFQFSSPQLTPLSTSHSLSASPADEFVEPSGPYPELVGCLMYLMTCTRPDLAYPLSLLARYVAPELGELSRSPPVLYVDNKAMIALCQEPRLEHSTKHIALRYFIARELQQRGQLRLAYVATRAITADVFTKALPPGDHQRFATVLGLVPTLPHLLTA
ncbi:unnamed protein product, partial [Closterium sp. NIES-53]